MDDNAVGSKSDSNLWHGLRIPAEKKNKIKNKKINDPQSGILLLRMTIMPPRTKTRRRVIAGHKRTCHRTK